MGMRAVIFYERSVKKGIIPTFWPIYVYNFDRIDVFRPVMVITARAFYEKFEK